MPPPPPLDRPSAPPAPAASFALVCPSRAYRDLSKSDDGRQLRIAGVISTENLYLQEERVLQKGLDFTEFLGKWGFFNNDHGKNYLDIVGVPESVQFYPAGAQLPDGSQAEHACTWCEGALTDDGDGRRTFDKAMALQKLGRCLGYSIEGDVVERRGDGDRVISKAMVKHCAITHQPINRGAVLGPLLRSLAMGLGSPSGAGPVRPGAYAGADGGRAYAREDLARQVVALDAPAGRAGRRGKKAKKSPPPGAALESIYRALPGVSPGFALALLAHLPPRTRP